MSKFLNRLVIILFCLIVILGAVIYFVPNLQIKLANAIVNRSSLYNDAVADNYSKQGIIDDLEVQILTLKGKVSEYEDQIKSLQESSNSSILEKDKEIKQLSDKVSSLNDDIANLQAKIKTIQDNDNLTISQKDTEIQKLNDNINSLTTTINADNAKITSLNNEIESIKIARDNEVRDLNNQINSLNQTIAELKQGAVLDQGLVNLNINYSNFFVGIMQGNNFVFYICQELSSKGALELERNSKLSYTNAMALNHCNYTAIHNDYSYNITTQGISDSNYSGTTVYNILPESVFYLTINDEMGNPFNFDNAENCEYYLSQKDPISLVTTLQPDRSYNITSLTMNLILSKSLI